MATVVAGAAPPTVGIEGRLRVVAPAGQLDVLPLNRTNRLIARIVGTQPMPGQSNLYDIRFVGLVPGQYDVRAVMCGADAQGSTNAPLIVQVAALLPTNHNGALAFERTPQLGVRVGYRWRMGGLWLAWAGALAPLIWLGRQKKVVACVMPTVAPPTPAALLAPLVAKAREGSLTVQDKARMEQLLMCVWRERLMLADASPGSLRVHVRAHAETGCLLTALEQWLYEPPGRHACDIAALLACYLAPAQPAGNIRGAGP